ncbi:carboxyltransferase domain-containing protein [Kocuria massiliensis]|uniref:5-oxoprolinase subunit B/C family protein n=1 Tax=Kocuria massiliensis TaxID=1926282 RepID=UPI000A1CCC66|nr:carboxyltransferase domain-containing protein [Kocuria massiliensis]
MTHDSADSAHQRTVHTVGRSALLVTCPDLKDVLALHEALTHSPLPGQLELIPAATTVLVRFRSRLSTDAAHRTAAHLRSLRGVSGSASEANTVELPVQYHGEDLDDVAEHLGISTDAVIDRHSGRNWTAAFSGFSPGFAYLVPADGDDTAPLTVPRRSSPRTKVPAGSVALAGDFSAVYPSDSPGGWQLIGTTNSPVWDLSREVPALITPGTRVRFTATRESMELQESASAEPSDSPDEGTIRIEAPGLSTIAQDPGRRGHIDWGVSPSGWADAEAAESANRLVGNDPAATVLENTAGGLSLTALRDTVLAVTGARTEVTVSGDQPPRRPENRPFALLEGQRLTLGPTTRGLRVYVAVRGGFQIDAVLGSSATDTLARLGPPPITRGTMLQAGPEPRHAVLMSWPAVDLPPADGVTDIPFTPGPRDDWFTEDSLNRLNDFTWRVAQESNRVGVRLAPPESTEGATPLVRTNAAQAKELPSEGVVAGSIQVPPNGHPVIFMADHPVTGGYPVIGVVEPEHLRLLAQAPPGTAVRLHHKTSNAYPESPTNLTENIPCAKF